MNLEVDQNEVYEIVRKNWKISVPESSLIREREFITRVHCVYSQSHSFRVDNIDDICYCHNYWKESSWRVCFFIFVFLLYPFLNFVCLFHFTFNVVSWCSVSVFRRYWKLSLKNVVVLIKLSLQSRYDNEILK